MRIEKISILTIKRKARTNKVVVSTEVNFYILKNLLFPGVHLRIIALIKRIASKKKKKKTVLKKKCKTSADFKFAN
jgi:hypothetical protein